MIGYDFVRETTIKGQKITFWTKDIRESDRIFAQYPGKDLNVTLEPIRKKRSVDANALLWHCVGVIAKSINADKWDIYLKLLKSYGKYTYLCVHPNAVDEIKKQWRETEVVGNVTINGKPAVQLLCYYGSSTYNSKEFNDLLDGTIAEMHEMGLETPDDEKVRSAIEALERRENGGA